MNYLAHFELASGDEGLIIGGLLGDFVKGPLKGTYSEEWERGIRLHRRVDAYTDSHAMMKEGQRILGPEFRRYAGIMLDVLFDHYLNRHWDRFHPETLGAFSQETYRYLSAADSMPDAAKVQANNLVKYDVLSNVQHWETITATLERIGQRLRSGNPMDRAAVALEANYDELEALFLGFYPDVQAHVRSFREELFKAD